MHRILNNCHASPCTGMPGYLCFVDYEKAFDRVKHPKLMELLRNIAIDQKRVRCIENLYWYHTEQIRFNNELSNDVKIRRGVLQGCALSHFCSTYTWKGSSGKHWTISLHKSTTIKKGNTAYLALLMRNEKFDYLRC